jgi:sigma-E factor negative regulatory protein RseB
MMSVLRRPVLLLSAAVTITVPGLLAGLAVCGHEHPKAEPAPQAGAGMFGAAGTTANGTMNGTMNGGASAALSVHPVQATGAMSLGNVEASDRQAVGMRLLSQAAAAGLTSSYQGVEMISQWTVDGTIAVVSTVWHRSGGRTVTQTADAAALADSQPYVSYDGDDHDPEGVFGVTTTLVGLLGANYLVEYEGTGTVAGRPALIVEAHRANGSLAARFWLDKQTMLPLRREVYDSDSHLLSEDAFLQVQFGQQAAQAGVAQTASPARESWVQAAAPARLVKDLNDKGWHLPAALPGNLSLYAAAQAGTATGKVVHLGYSDGLFVVSLFVQRGTLSPKMAGWQLVSMAGHPVYVGQHSITWASKGFVYTVLADAPPQTVDAVVGSLPKDTAPSFLVRMRRGFARLAALVNPFR